MSKSSTSPTTESQSPSAQRSQKPLPQNPFTTHRDPITGRWVVVMAEDGNQS